MTLNYMFLELLQEVALGQQNNSDFFRISDKMGFTCCLQKHITTPSYFFCCILHSHPKQWLNRKGKFFIISDSHDTKEIRFTTASSRSA